MMLNPRSFLLDAWRALSLIGISISVAVTSVGSQAGNTPGATAAADGNAAVRPDLAFDVVSIRPAPDTRDRSFGTRDDEYRAIGEPLGITILLAYFPPRMGSKDRIIGAPSWVWDDSYEFVGKVGETDLPEWQHSQRGIMAPNPMLQIMLQNALTDRCKLAIHRIPMRINGFALVAANHGPNRKNLVESNADDVIPDKAVSIALDGRMVPIFSHDDPVLHFYQTSMASLVLLISGPGAPIEDRTGLSGKYKFDLTRLGTDGIPTSDWDLAPLGLKLIPTKIRTEQIVIDHIERPSPN